MSRVEGLAQKLECSGETLRFHVLVEKKVMVFEIPDPDRVVIKHSGEIKHDFACGPQKGNRVAGDYAGPPVQESANVGVFPAVPFTAPPPPPSPPLLPTSTPSPPHPHTPP